MDSSPLETFYKRMDVALQQNSAVNLDLKGLLQPNRFHGSKRLQLLPHLGLRCLLGSVVHVGPPCSHLLRPWTTLPRRHRDQGGREVHGRARRTNGLGRCWEVAPGRAGRLGPRAVREFRTGRKERRRARSRRRYSEPAAASGVQLFGFFFFRKRVLGHCFLSASPCRASPALLADCGRFSPLPSRRRPVIPPEPGPALFLPKGGEGTFPSLSRLNLSCRRHLPGPAGRERGGAELPQLPLRSGAASPPSRAVGTKAAFGGSGLSCFLSCGFFFFLSSKARWRRLSKSYTLPL